MTRQHFDIQLGRLIVLRNWPDDVSEWWTACRLVDSEVFEAACGHALKSRAFFPVPAELLADCDAVKGHVRPIEPEPEPSYRDLETARVVEIRNPFDGTSITVKVIRDWPHDCESCSDTGWELRQCQGAVTCGRRQPHSAHTYAQTCGCIEWNPTIKRRKAVQMKYSQQKAS